MVESGERNTDEVLYPPAVEKDDAQSASDSETSDSDSSDA